MVTWMRYFGTDRSHKCTWNRESGRDPTIGVYDMNRNIVVVDALNRIADILERVVKWTVIYKRIQLSTILV